MTVRKMMLAYAALALVVIGAGCGTLKIAGQPIGAQPTSTNTRVVRPTFTLIPTDTDTPVPTNTAISTSTPIPPTATATKKPVIVPTKPPATATRIPATAPPAPTANPYQYQLMSQDCQHSGGTYLVAYIFSNYAGGSGTTLSGVKVRASYSLDGPALGGSDVISDDSGKAQYTLSINGPRPGTWYLWVVDDAGHRISPPSGAITTNALGEDAAGSCWLARVAFAISP